MQYGTGLNEFTNGTKIKVRIFFMVPGLGDILVQNHSYVSDFALMVGPDIYA